MCTGMEPDIPIVCQLHYYLTLNLFSELSPLVSYRKCDKATTSALILIGLHL